MKNRKKVDQIRFDKDKVVCISLKSHSDEHLSAICDNLSLSFESISALKSEGIFKIWIEKNGEYLISFTTLKEPDYMNICENYSEFADNLTMICFLKKIVPVPTPKIKKKRDDSRVSTDLKSSVAVDKDRIILEVDTILEKIFKYGIQSISKKEKDFLDSRSKL